MRISIEKTKTLAIAMDPTRWKLAMDNKIIEQVAKVEYLKIKISNDGKVEEELKQINRVNRVAGCYTEKQTLVSRYQEQNL
jgi:hypothetical protein